MNWERYPHFKREEFVCTASGECEMQEGFIALLQGIRDKYRRPMPISSGYRSVKHPLEAHKEFPGEHTYGMACDVRVYGKDALDLIDIAYQCGIRRIGVNQKGYDSHRFIHLGVANRFTKNFPESIWSY